MTPGMMLFGTFCVAVGFGFGILAFRICGPSLAPLDVEHLGICASAEGPRP